MTCEGSNYRPGSWNEKGRRSGLEGKSPKLMRLHQKALSCSHCRAVSGFILCCNQPRIYIFCKAFWGNKRSKSMTNHREWIYCPEGICWKVKCRSLRLRFMHARGEVEVPKMFGDLRFDSDPYQFYLILQGNNIELYSWALIKSST